jgi:hypothetical protein
MGWAFTLTFIIFIARQSIRPLKHVGFLADLKVISAALFNMLGEKPIA